ncbi:MAG TPA: hypothetical protein VKY31_08475 [Terriglobia bacterium]|nr:hypothetical protein [Terriglobia bacterium]
MTRNELLHFLAREILSRKDQNKPIKNGIDGRCAAGSSIPPARRRSSCRRD